MSLSQDVEKLKVKFTDPAFTEDKERIIAWARDVKKAELRENLSKNPIIKEIITNIKTDIAEMKVVLQGQEINSEKDMIDRKSIKFRKDLYSWFLGLFEISAGTLKAIEKEVKDNL